MHHTNKQKEETGHPPAFAHTQYLVLVSAATQLPAMSMTCCLSSVHAHTNPVCSYTHRSSPTCWWPWVVWISLLSTHGWIFFGGCPITSLVNSGRLQALERVLLWVLVCRGWCLCWISAQLMLETASLHGKQMIGAVGFPYWHTAYSCMPALTDVPPCNFLFIAAWEGLCSYTWCTHCDSVSRCSMLEQFDCLRSSSHQPLLQFHLTSHRS